MRGFPPVDPKNVSIDDYHHRSCKQCCRQPQRIPEHRGDDLGAGRCYYQLVGESDDQPLKVVYTFPNLSVSTACPKGRAQPTAARLGLRILMSRFVAAETWWPRQRVLKARHLHKDS